MRRKTIGLFKIAVALLLTLASFSLPMGISRVAASEHQKAQNVIIMIVDGCGSEQYTLARWFKGAPLSFDGILVGAVKTYIADSVVADSAPAASAYATGCRTSDKFISVGARGGTLPVVPAPASDVRYRPLATVLEGARLKGMATGIVSTSRVTHATPAAYVAHVPDRNMENDIMEQAVYQHMDVVFGGGKRHLLPKEAGGKRHDGEDLTRVLKQDGYQIVETRNEMLRLGSGKVFGMFAPSHMEAEIDRPEFAPGQPTLEEMTQKAIELLSKSSQGFFLMVEASQVDWACHANDPAHLLSDLTMYDKAVKLALDFAEKDGHTLVIALSDHNTGGMSIGNYATSKTYSQMKLGQLAEPVSENSLLAPLRKMRLSAYGLFKKMGKEITLERLRTVVKQYWEVDISDEDARQIIAVGETFKDQPHYGIGEVLSARYTSVGWSTHGHTGGDVPLFALGPGRPAGLVDAPEIGKITADALGLDMEALNERLFVDAGRVFGKNKVTVDRSDENNLEVKIEVNEKIAELPVNKSLLKLGARTVDLEGVVVYSPQTDRVYIPMEAVNLLESSNEVLPSVVK